MRYEALDRRLSDAVLDHMQRLPEGQRAVSAEDLLREEVGQPEDDLHAYEHALLVLSIGRRIAQVD